MRVRSTVALAAALLAALALTACSAPAAAPDDQPPPPRVAAAPGAGPLPATPEPVAARQAPVSVRHPKAVDAQVDCRRLLPLLARATGVRPVLRGDSTAELCRFDLGYRKVTTTASVFFRAEPPGTPSYRPAGELFGNTAYRLGGSGKDCGVSVALDAAKQPHEHGSHLTVLATYEGVEQPCSVTTRVVTAVFDLLEDA